MGTASLRHLETVDDPIVGRRAQKELRKSESTVMTYHLYIRSDQYEAVHPCIRCRSKILRLILLLLMFPLHSLATDDPWPGLPPDCWSGSRLVHDKQKDTLWEKNTEVFITKESKPQPGARSPNSGYFFIVENGHQNGKVTIYTEKEHLIQIKFTELSGLSHVQWINEKLIFMRPWWGRIKATDLIYDVENEKFIYSEGVTDGYIGYQQYLESCPLIGCDCIKKREDRVGD